MKTVQKLEVFFGAATLLTALLSFYFVHSPLMRHPNSENSSIEGFIFRPLIFFFLPAFLTCVGSYIHSTKQSISGFVITIIFGSIVTFFHAVGFLIGTSFNGYLLLGISPGVFAFTTVILAFVNTVWRTVKHSNFH